jgi:hypothetical protein
VTTIQETNFSLELPGEWEAIESGEPATFLYRDTAGDGAVSVMLLAVRPVYAIADPKRLLEDYLHHRSNYEAGQTPSAESSEPVSEQLAASVEGGWSSFDAAAGIWVRHRVVLQSSLLADFRYQTSAVDEAAFSLTADTILASATLAVG